jgi:hypothetical protein
LSGTPGSRGAPELRLAPASSAEDTREKERMSRRLSGAGQVFWCARRQVFYRRERESRMHPEVGVRRRASFNAGHGGFGSVLAR